MGLGWECLERKRSTIVDTEKLEDKILDFVKRNFVDPVQSSLGLHSEYPSFAQSV